MLPSDRVTFDALYGLEIVEEGQDVMRALVPVTELTKQPFGLVHGGVFCAIGEALASIGTGLAVQADGNTAMGMSNHTNFLRPIVEGTIHAVARPRHRGRTTWIWDVDISDDAGALCATGRITIAVRPIPQTGSPAR